MPTSTRLVHTLGTDSLGWASASFDGHLEEAIRGVVIPDHE